MKQIHFIRRKAGFSLIEVLVAATLIGILSTIGLTSFQAITRNGRDALRKSELEQIRSALEIYKSENNLYPTANTACIADLSTNYINPYPADPKPTPYKYCYAPAANWKSYQLCAHLENGNATDDLCGGSSKCVSNCNYQVINP